MICNGDPTSPGVRVPSSPLRTLTGWFRPLIPANVPHRAGRPRRAFRLRPILIPMLMLIPAFAVTGNLRAFQADQSALEKLTGRWEVIPNRLWPDIAPSLTQCEIRPPDGLGNIEVIGYADADTGAGAGEKALPKTAKALRISGRGRLDRIVRGPLEARWFRTSWKGVGSTVQVQLRLEAPDTLRIVTRERTRNSDPRTQLPETVREMWCARVPAQPSTATTKAPGSSRPPQLNVLRADVELAGVFVVTADGKDLRSVAGPWGFSRADEPAWSRDGAYLAFAAYDEVGRDPVIRIVSNPLSAFQTTTSPPTPAIPKAATEKSSAKGPTTTTPEGLSLPTMRTMALAAGVHPQFSPDGNQLVYVTSGRDPLSTDWNNLGRNQERIELITLRGPKAGQVERLVDGFDPCFAPNDRRMAFVASSVGNTDIFLRDAEGFGLTRLTSHPAMDSHPLWSADGASVIFFSNRGNRWDLYRIPVTQPGRNPMVPEAVQLTNNRQREDQAAISPDGVLLAFTNQLNSPNSHILIMDLNTEQNYILTNAPNGDRAPSWSPTGQYIGFVSRRVP